MKGGQGVAERRRLAEQIVDRITTTLQRMVGYEQPPETDSAIETRKTADEVAGPMVQGAWEWYEEAVSLEQTRRAKYRDFDLMDAEDPVLNSALDVYADNATKGDSGDDKVVEIVSNDELVVEILSDVRNRLALDTETWSIARSLAKYGDDFEEVVVHEDMEVHRLKNLDASEMNVKTDKYGRYDPEFPFEQVRPDTGAVVARLREWQVLHFRLKRNRKSKYGVDGSILAPVRKVFKQLSMMEDALVIARLTRAPQRYGFLVDVDGIEPGEPTIEYLNKVKDMMKKRRTIDPVTGKMDLKFNPLSMEEDLFVGVRSNGKADVKVLQGQANLGQLGDIEFFQNKLFAGIKVPKAYLGFERDVNAKATLTEQDVQFARSVRRIQLAIIEQYRKLFDFVLAVRGIDPTSVEYTIKLPVISTIDELRMWQVKKLKAEVAKVLRKEVGLSFRWILQNMLELTDEDIEDILADYEEPESVDNRIMMAVGGETTAVPAEEEISDRELRLVKYRLSEEIEALKEFLDWKLESERGRGLTSQREMVSV